MSASESMKSTGKKKSLCLCWTMVLFPLLWRDLLAEATWRREGWFGSQFQAAICCGWRSQHRDWKRHTQSRAVRELMLARLLPIPVHSPGSIKWDEATHIQRGSSYLSQLAPALVPTDMSADQPDLDNSSIDSHPRWFEIGHLNN